VPLRPALRAGDCAQANLLVKRANSGIVLAPDLMRVVGEVLAEIRALQERLFRAYSGDDPKPTE
jgi:hypothetical protein